MAAHRELQSVSVRVVAERHKFLKALLSARGETFQAWFERQVDRELQDFPEEEFRQLVHQLRTLVHPKEIGDS